MIVKNFLIIKNLSNLRVSKPFTTLEIKNMGQLKKLYQKEPNELNLLVFEKSACLFQKGPK